MSVDISKLVKETDDFMKKQLKDFQSFVDTSKKLIGAKTTEEDKAKDYYKQMQSSLSSLQDPIAANGLSPIETLESSPGYVASLSTIEELPADLNKPSVSIKYMNDFQKEVDKDMKQRGSDDE